MNKQFQELKVGERFLYNGQEFVKTEDVRVSCCRTINAKASNDNSNTTYIQPGTLVVVNA